MRVLIAVHQFFPTWYTGTERLALDLSKQMQRMGHSVTVLTYHPEEAEGFEEHGQSLLKRYDYMGVPVIAVRHQHPPAQISFGISDPVLQRTIENIMSEERFDVLHILHPMRIGMAAKAALQRGIPFVLTLTDFWLMCPKGIGLTNRGDVCLSSEGGEKCVRECYGEAWREGLAERFSETRALLRAAGCVVSATNSLRRVFELGGLVSDIRLMPYGEDYAGVRPNTRTYTPEADIALGFLSTLQPHKGPHVLLEAYNIARRENIALKIFGSHFQQTDYYTMLRRLAGEDGKVQFLGEYSYEDMPRIYNEIDMIVVPSTWWENSPLVLSRALAHNVPAIVSDLGGMTEMVKDNENGFTFQVSKPESLADVLRRIADDPSILNRLKQHIRRPPRIEEHAFEYEKIYRTLAPEK